MSQKDVFIERDDYFGSQECPFEKVLGNDSPDASDEYTFINNKTGEKLIVGSILLHFIAKHSFFEGSVSYRLDPQKIIKFFGISPGVYYKYDHVTKTIIKIDHYVAIS